VKRRPEVARAEAQRARPAAKRREDAVREEAWIGDAVLALYVRLKIVGEDGRLDGAKAIRMTSNEFLAGVGEPTAIEAEIGRAYSAGGLDEAFRHIEQRLMPAFSKQEEKRLRRAGQTAQLERH
jgi:23S rRNA maturation mini-RNase III